MQCPYCGHIPSQGDQFCGKCGFQFGNNLPTLLSQKQALSYNSASTVVGSDLRTAMAGVDNPYNVLYPGRKMSRLILDDDSQRIWSEIDQSPLGIARYENNVFHLQGRISTGIIQSSYTFGNFTFQALIEFHYRPKLPSTTNHNMLMFRYTTPSVQVVWNLWAQHELSTGTVWMGWASNHWNLRVPSYKPFLLGIIKDGSATYFFVNLELVCRIKYADLSDREEGPLVVATSNADVIMHHSKIWI